jgi:hypothetical protein
MSIAERLDQLVAIYGSVRAVGRALGIDHVYLHRLAKGEKTAPSPSVLAKLGLRRIVTITYEPN